MDKRNIISIMFIALIGVAGAMLIHWVVDMLKGRKRRDKSPARIDAFDTHDLATIKPSQQLHEPDLMRMRMEHLENIVEILEAENRKLRRS